MSTVRPDCCPSRQPITLYTPLGLAPAPLLLALVRVWWSEMLIRQSCRQAGPADQLVRNGLGLGGCDHSGAVSQHALQRTPDPRLAAHRVQVELQPAGGSLGLVHLHGCLHLGRI